MGTQTDIGTRLRELRAHHPSRPTQSEVADAIGISRAHLAKIETGKDAPGRSTLAAFATYYNVSMDYLESGTEAIGAKILDESFSSDDKRAWLLLGAELDEDQRLSVVDFVRKTVLGHRRRRSGQRGNKK